MRRLLAILLGCLVAVTALAADAPATRAPARDALKPGQFLWHPEIAPSGPIVLVVSLDEQRAYVYRNGLAIGVSTISSGKPGNETPTGVPQAKMPHRQPLAAAAVPVAQLTAQTPSRPVRPAAR